MRGFDGICLIFTQVDAAKAVVQLMYEGVVPTTLSAADLVKVSSTTQLRCLYWSGSCLSLSSISSTLGATHSYKGAMYLSAALNMQYLLPAAKLLCVMGCSLHICMCQHVTVTGTACQLQMCRVADHWEAEDCLISCLKRLIQLPDKDLGCAQLAQLLPQLPASIRQLPQYKEWEQKLMQILVASAKASTALDASSAYLLVYLFADVHSLLTSQPQLKCFRQLPFHAVKAWAASDNLVVDSENSVVIALSSWIKAAGDCSTEQQKELSSLIRVKHLTPGMYFARYFAACVVPLHYCHNAN
jgi:hypothetical protein